jgi:hypothetical protein
MRYLGELLSIAVKQVALEVTGINSLVHRLKGKLTQLVAVLRMYHHKVSCLNCRGNMLADEFHMVQLQFASD